MVTSTEQLTPPDRGFRWFLRNQTPWSGTMLGAGIALLTFFFIGSIAVLTHYGWTQSCPEGVTRLECSPSDPLADGIASGGLALVARLTVIIGILLIVAAFASWKRMPNKPAREAVISGGVLALQAITLAGFVIWFRGTDVPRFARNFLNIALIGDHVGIAWDALGDNVTTILRSAVLTGAVIGGMAAVWSAIRKTGRRVVVWAAAIGFGLGGMWQIMNLAEVPSFVRGAKNTLVLSGWGAVLGFGLGLVIALLTMSKRAVVRAPARIYINFFRGTPLIWQISFAGIGFVPALRLDLSMYTVAILVLGLNLAAYSAEVYRAGIQSLERGQIEASRTLGLSYFQSMQYVIVPQAIRRVIPPLLNEFVILIKDTSLVFILGLTVAQKELLGTARDFYSTFFDATAWLGAAAGYLIITIPMIRIVTIVERRMRSGLTSVIG
jgi:His/Glu/Gln/Arg/opine family amino acid ABC transporter permease subunit